MRYERLVEVSIRHRYYDDDRCSDFDIVTTSATQALLDDHRLLFRLRPDGFSLSSPVDDGRATSSRPADGPLLNFDLRLRNHSLPLFTDLAAFDAIDKQPTAPMLIAGVGDDEVEVEIEERELREKVEFGPPSMPQPKPPPTSTPASRRFAKRKPEVDGRLPTAERFARLAIAVPQPGSSPRHYVLRLEPAKIRWSYYCVTDLDPDGEQLSLRDSSTANRVAFTDGRDLRTSPDPDDRVGASLNKRYPDSRLVRFVSTQPVSSRRVPTQVVGLLRSGVPLEPERKLLPVRSFDTRTMVEVRTSGETRRVPALTQVFFYTNQQSQPAEAAAQ